MSNEKSNGKFQAENIKNSILPDEEKNISNEGDINCKIENIINQKNEDNIDIMDDKIQKNPNLKQLFSVKNYEAEKSADLEKYGINKSDVQENSIISPIKLESNLKNKEIEIKIKQNYAKIDEYQREDNVYLKEKKSEQNELNQAFIKRKKISVKPELSNAVNDLLNKNNFKKVNTVSSNNYISFMKASNKDEEEINSKIRDRIENEYEDFHINLKKDEIDETQSELSQTYIEENTLQDKKNEDTKLYKNTEFESKEIQEGKSEKKQVNKFEIQEEKAEIEQMTEEDKTREIPLIKSVRGKNTQSEDYAFNSYDDKRDKNFGYYNTSGMKSTIPSYPENDIKKIVKKSIYAGFWIRVLAFLIDYFIVLGIKNIFSYFNTFAIDPIIESFLFVIIFVLYNFILVYITNGYTIGKILTNIKVVSETNKRIGFLTAVTREIVGKFILLKTFILPLFLVFSEKKHHLIDYLSDTSVIKQKYTAMYEELKSEGEL